MKVGREVTGECMSLCMGMTVLMTHYFGDMEPEETNCYIQKEPQWSNRDTNPPTKLSTQNLSCLQEMQGWGMEQRLREWPTNNWPNLRPIPWASTNP